MKTVGDKLESFSVVGVKPGFNPAMRCSTATAIGSPKSLAH